MQVDPHARKKDDPAPSHQSESNDSKNHPTLEESIPRKEDGQISEQAPADDQEATEKDYARLGFWTSTLVALVTLIIAVANLVKRAPPG